MKYTSDRIETGMLKAATNNGKRIYSNNHLYILKRNGIWRELC